MILPPRTVTKENGPRPAGRADQCFYCNQPIGSEHKPDCVLLKRVIIAKVTIELPIAVVDSFTDEDLDFYWHLGSSCKNNVIRHDVGRYMQDDGPCLCHAVGVSMQVERVREATAEEIAAMPEQEE